MELRRQSMAKFTDSPQKAGKNDNTPSVVRRLQHSDALGGCTVTPIWWLVGWFLYHRWTKSDAFYMAPTWYLFKEVVCCTGLDICVYLSFLCTLYIYIHTHHVCAVYTDVLYIYMRMIFTSLKMSLQKFCLFGYLTFFSCEMKSNVFPSAI